MYSKLIEIYVKEMLRVLASLETDASTNKQVILLQIMNNNTPFMAISIPKGKIYEKSCKEFNELLDIKGIGPTQLGEIIKSLRNKIGSMKEEVVGYGIEDIYILLCEYVRNYEFPDQAFFSQSGEEVYCNIEEKHLGKVLAYLGIDKTPLELKRTFKALGGLRVNNNTGHKYAYKIGKNWYFSFRLNDKALKGGEQHDIQCY